MQAFSTHMDDIEQLRQWIATLPVSSSDEILIQLYSGQGHQRAEQFSVLMERAWPNAIIIGASSVQTFAGADVADNKTLVNVCLFETTQVKCHLQNLSHNFEQDGRQLFHSLVQADTKAVIALADGITAADPQVFDAFNVFHRAIPVAGGVAMPDPDTGDAWVLLNGQCYRNALVAVSLNSNRLRSWRDVFVEWFPIGKRLAVTRAEGKRVFELDGAPAYHKYCQYLGDGRSTSFSQCQDFPLMTGAQRGRGIISPLALFEDGSIEFTEPFSEGEKVQFCYSHPSLTQERVENGGELLAQYKPEGIFVFNCSARSVLADGKPEVELKPLASSAPTHGFFCYGEFFRGEAQHIVHHSLTYIAFSENEATPILTTPASDRGSNALTPLFRLLRNALGDLDQMTEDLELQVAEKSKALLASYRTDRLTGLPNHLGLKETLRKEHDIAQIVVIKLTNLSHINEQYGHTSGDRVLIEMTRRLTRFVETRLHPPAELYSVSPSEWVISVHVGMEDAALEMAVSDFVDLVEHTEFSLEEKFSTDCLNVTLAAGIAHRQDLKGDLHDFDELVLKAHEARRAALRRNMLVCTAAQIESERGEIQQRMAALGLVNRALLQGGVKMYGHGIFKAGSREQVATECLVRLELDGQLYQPGSFLPAVQYTHLYSRLSRRVIALCFDLLDPRQEQYTINLAPQDLQDERTIELLLDMLGKLKHPECAGFEIVETEQIENYDKLRDVARALRNKGARLIIDDFGSGYSNIDEILQLEPDIIKLDGSLIRYVDSNVRQRTIVEHVIKLCKSLGIKTVAEFVHNEKVCRIVEEMGVNFVQGFYLSMPQPLD